MGFDKQALLVDGVPNGLRIARALRRVATPALQVGPGQTGLPAVVEDPPGAGPLAAVGAGAAALRRWGHHGSALVLWGDLPLVDERALALLAGWPGTATVVPVLGGRPQPLCARWSPGDLDAVAGLLATGARSMGAALDRPGVELLEEQEWSASVGPRAFADADTPSDLDRLGVCWQAP